MIVTDFSAEDRLVFQRFLFAAAFDPGREAPLLVAGTAPVSTDAALQFLYETGTGKLWIDADGTGEADPIWIARLMNRGAPATLTEDQLGLF